MSQPVLRTQRLLMLPLAEVRRGYRRILRGQWLGGDRPATRDDLRRAALALAGPSAILTQDSAGELCGGTLPETDAVHVGIVRGVAAALLGLSQILQRAEWSITGRFVRATGR